MRLALTVWNDRVAPVFDVAKQLLLIEIRENKIVAQQLIELPDKFVAGKVAALAELRLSVLVCGAVSRQAEALLEAHGIPFYSFVAGEINPIIRSWLASDFNAAGFAMPGCRRHGRHRRNRRRGL